MAHYLYKYVALFCISIYLCIFSAFILNFIFFFFRTPRICRSDRSCTVPRFLSRCGYFLLSYPTLSTLLYWNILPGWYWLPSWVITFETVPEEVCGSVPSDLPVLFPTTYTWVFLCSFLIYYIGSWVCIHLQKRVTAILSSIYETCHMILYPESTNKNLILF